ncbi:hypothetical protein Q1695_008721 [Nippostrongylus brasiliensis]|nr:hypothetical protein Q1695_008721 [Nippostrongylus brasiliensis]
MVKSTSYEYTALQHLPDSGRVNVYGVVRSITTTTCGGIDLRIEDENSSVLVKIAKDFQKPFQKVKMDDIIRIHRVEVGSCQGEPALILEVGAYGCHAVVWSGSSNVPTFVTSKNYTNTEYDISRLAALRKWMGVVESADEVVMVDVAAPLAEECEKQPHSFSMHDMVTPPGRRRSSNFPSDVDACDIPALGKNFFNWFGQVLGVYKAKGEPPTTVLRAWDGTEPVFDDDIRIFYAESDSIESTHCEASSELISALQGYTIDVCCYGEWATKAFALKVGDVVLLRNIRCYASQTRNYSAVTMHEGGARFQRALIVLDENDPKRHQISRRCAAITREIMEPEGGGAEPHEGVELPSAMNDAAAVPSPTAHAKVDQSTPYTKPRKRSKSLKFAKNSLVEEMELDREPESSTTVKEHEENAENLDGVSHSEDELLESIHQQLAKEIRRILIDWEIERLIKEICEPRPVKSSLTEEMEEILKGNAGDSVHLTNPVEADIDGMKEAEYLRIAVIFTAVCTQCNHEMVVQRCTKNWCSKCYSEQKLLHPVRYNYRVNIPSSYRRANGGIARLMLAIARSVWAEFPNAECMSVNSVMALYAEKNKLKFITELNHVIRFAEAVVKQRNVSNVTGTVVECDPVDGSVLLFVDQCSFTEKTLQRSSTNV